MLGQLHVGHFACRTRFTSSRDGFCDILREIDLALWKVLYAERLRIALELLPPIAEEFCSRKLKNLLCIVSAAATFYRLVTCILHCIVVNIVLSRSVNRHQNISVLSNGKPQVFDRRSCINTDIPSQEGREDLPSELGFALAPRQTDPTPVVTRPSEVSRPESTSAMVTRSCAREGRGISVAPEAPL